MFNRFIPQRLPHILFLLSHCKRALSHQSSSQLVLFPSPMPSDKSPTSTLLLPISCTSSFHHILHLFLVSFPLSPSPLPHVSVLWIAHPSSTSQPLNLGILLSVKVALLSLSIFSILLKYSLYLPSIPLFFSCHCAIFVYHHLVFCLCTSSYLSYIFLKWFLTHLLNFSTVSQITHPFFFLHFFIPLWSSRPCLLSLQMTVNDNDDLHSRNFFEEETF